MKVALNTVELEALLGNDPQLKFGGVKAYDQIPSAVTLRPCGFVFNTDPISKPGTHWISIYFDRQGSCQYFCSQGTAPFGKLRKFVEDNSHVIFFNKYSLQSLNSPYCGYYSVYHLLHASRGHSLHRIVNGFVPYPSLSNDKVVRSFVLDYASGLGWYG